MPHCSERLTTSRAPIFAAMNRRNCVRCHSAAFFHLHAEPHVCFIESGTTPTFAMGRWPTADALM